MKKCPFCAEQILDDAVVCKHCGRDLRNRSPEELARILDQAMAPYLARAYEVTGRTENTVTLTRTKEFSYLSLLLLILWPAFIVYLIVYFTTRRRSAFLHVLPTGEIKLSGYTVESLDNEKSRDRNKNLIGCAIIIGIIVLIVLINLLSQSSR